MSYNPQQPGFVIPPNSNQQPTYPAYPQPQQMPPAYNHQPFPGPIQQQPPYGQAQGPVSNWYANSNFQNYLRHASLFHVKQKVELLEALVGWETANKYTVKDQAGNKVFYVGEETECLTRVCLGKCRPFTLTVKDTMGIDILRIQRQLDCTCCCALFCGDTVTVSTPTGQLLGTIKEKFHILQPSFSVKDATGKTQLHMIGPACPIALCGQPVVFQIKTLNGVSIGTVSKEYGGLIREFFTDADSFNITFPQDMDPSMKAVLLGALFMIDYEYFEAGNDGQQGGRRLFG